jgi:hypothetical protein
MSETLTKIIVNCETGVVAEIPLTGEEIAQREADAQAAEQDRLTRETEETQKAAQKAEILARLNLTEDEVKLLLG